MGYPDAFVFQSVLLFFFVCLSSVIAFGEYLKPVEMILMFAPFLGELCQLDVVAPHCRCRRRQRSRHDVPTVPSRRRPHSRSERNHNSILTDVRYYFSKIITYRPDCGFNKLPCIESWLDTILSINQIEDGGAATMNPSNLNKSRIFQLYRSTFQ